jgi:DNA repair protein RecN (Recombination protein N)
MIPPSPAPSGSLQELAVRDLGIIEEIQLVLGAGMTALTGETGAGKTLLVGAIELLLGGRADPAMVRKGSAEAVVEGRFVIGEEEVVLTRVVPADGRSRAYIDGRMATAGALAERASELVDLHGQHAHRSLLSVEVQRAALDGFAQIDLAPLAGARAERRSVARALDALGGDAGTRAREADLLRFQLDELERAALEDPEEDRALDDEETLLADANAHRRAAAAAADLLASDGAASDLVGRALADLDGRAPFASSVARLRAIQAELSDVAVEVRDLGEAIEDDDERLALIRDRRHLLVELRRKYGTAPRRDAPEGGAGRLTDVIAYAHEVRDRLDALLGHDASVAELERRASAAAAAEEAAAAEVGRQRRAAAAPLAEAIEQHLAVLAMAGARFSVTVGPGDPGDDVAFLLAANRGATPAPLTKVASGGELARTLLALRLVLSVAPPVLVFDEVDAGIGGEAALAVGRALAALGANHQVLVVTHLPQVAAFADHQVTVFKELRNATTIASATPVSDEGRLTELSRMLSGTPSSVRVREAASELLALAATQRGR